MKVKVGLLGRRKGKRKGGGRKQIRQSNREEQYGQSTLYAETWTRHTNTPHYVQFNIHQQKVTA
jgi:hypothetical protein